jgi:signal transduction histidine kinase
MFFDDRLATVLRHRATGEASARTQYRQLLDILGNDKYGHDESLVAAAWLRLGALGETIPAKERAAIVREDSWRFRSPELAAHLAEYEPDVASAALSRAQLRDEDWVELIPRLPIRARGFLRLRKDLPQGAEGVLERLGVQDRGLPVPEHSVSQEAIATSDGASAKPAKSVKAAAVTGVAAASAGALVGAASTKSKKKKTNKPSKTASKKTTAKQTAPAKSKPPKSSTSKASTSKASAKLDPHKPRTSTSENEKSEITELVERIAQFRRERSDAPTPSESSPRLPLDEPAISRSQQIAGFGFVADTAGRIEWAEPDAAPMVIGKRLAPPRVLGAGEPGGPIARAIAAQMPIEGALLTLEGAPRIAGEWVVDAQPRFARLGGRFHGYVGRMRRPVMMTAEGAPSDSDRVRQLLHELRTPVNALQGFAEIIQQQLFGPAPNEYRALAANIAGDAARILAGFDELERLARLQSGVLTLAEGHASLNAIIARMIKQLQTVLAPRMAGFTLDDAAPSGIEIALGQDDAEAMIWRIMATLAGGCAAAEMLGVDMELDGESAQVTWDLPTQLLAEEDIFAAEIKPVGGGLSAGLFGAGFSLRLARAEARTVGGNLVLADDRLCLTLPLLTGDSSHPSPEDETGSVVDDYPAG